MVNARRYNGSASWYLPCCLGVVVDKIHQYNLNKMFSLPVQYGQAVNGLCEVRILFIKDSLPDTQRALVSSSGLDKLAGDPKQIT